MYQVGQFILYGRTGVCRVDGTISRTVPGENPARLYYVLHPVYQNGSIWAPVDSVDNRTIFTRPIMSRDEAQAFIEHLPTLTSEPYYNPNLGQLREYYRQQLESLSGENLALLICSIYRKKQRAKAENRKLGTVDEQVFHDAENILYGELAISLGLDREEVKGYIDKTLREA